MRRAGRALPPKPRHPERVYYPRVDSACTPDLGLITKTLAVTNRVDSLIYWPEVRQSVRSASIRIGDMRQLGIIANIGFARAQPF